MYNLIVTSEAGTWDGNRYALPLVRLGEYTAEALKARYRTLDAQAMAELKSFPTLFAYESAQDLAARVGHFTGITQGSRQDVRFHFRLIDEVPPIKAKQLTDIAWDLDIGDWEMNRTHWAIKDVDLVGVLRNIGHLDLGNLPEDWPIALDQIINPPRVFISYSHDDEKHKNWVRKLATDLRERRVDAVLDQWDLRPGQDMTRFMGEGISRSNRVILICSREYVEKAELGKGGVGYERLIISKEIYQKVDGNKFIPIIRNNSSAPRAPSFIGPRLDIDFRTDEDYEQHLEELVNEIHGMSDKPPLGRAPVTAGPSATAVSAQVASLPQGPSIKASPQLVLGTAGDKSFEEPWFQNHRRKAREGLKASGLTGNMEVAFSLANSVSKSSKELLDVAHKSLIHTFGWPLGIILTRDEKTRPWATQEGIQAEILTERDSYDYWSFRNSGDYYLLTGLFENSRDPNAIFFDSRIVRTTEAFLLCSGLYRNLGLRNDAVVGIQVTHRGFSGRKLTSANPARFIHEERAKEDASQTTLVMTLADLERNLVNNIRTVLEPMFALFNFKQIGHEVYEDLVINYKNGKVG